MNKPPLKVVPLILVLFRCTSLSASIPGERPTFLQSILTPTSVTAYKIAPEVKVTASYNKVTVSNNNSHAVTITWKYPSGKTVVHTLSSGAAYSPRRPGKKWSRGEVHSSSVSVIYDKKAYQRDVNALRTNYERAKVNITNNQNAKVSNLNNEYALRGLFAGASHVKSSSDDGFWEKLFKDAIRIGGKIGNFFFSTIDVINYLNSAQYKTWDDLLYDAADEILMKKAKQAAAQKFSRLINLDEDILEDGIDIVGNYIVAYHKILVETERLEERIDNQFEASSAAFQQLLENSSNRVQDLTNLEYTAKPFNFQLEVAAMPLNHGNSLNDNWKANPERFYRESDSGNDEDFGDIEDALWNGNIAASARLTATRSFKLISRRDRIFLGGSFSNNYYDFQRHDGYSIPNAIFSRTQPGGFSIKFPVVYELQQLSYDLSYRIGIGGIGNLTLTGGYLHQKGSLNFNYAELNEGWEWKDEKVEVTESERQPYYGAAFQLRRRNAQSRLHLYTAFRSYQSDLTLDPAYQFTYTAGSRIDQQNKVDTDGRWVYRIQTGLVLTL